MYDKNKLTLGSSLAGWDERDLDSQKLTVSISNSMLKYV